MPTVSINSHYNLMVQLLNMNTSLRPTGQIPDIVNSRTNRHASNRRNNVDRDFENVTRNSNKYRNSPKHAIPPLAHRLIQEKVRTCLMITYTRATSSMVTKYINTIKTDPVVKTHGRRYCTTSSHSTLSISRHTTGLKHLARSDIRATSRLSDERNSQYHYSSIQLILPPFQCPIQAM